VTLVSGRSTSVELPAAAADLTLQEVSAWANLQARRLAAGYGLDLDGAPFVLAQTVKLGEEVGELHAEILGRVGLHHRSKDGAYSSGSLANELADVTICVAILAELLDVNLSEAVSSKIARLEARYGDR
jgi:NTP pyrophosphatase (non-canonical NTP hydrolase)